MSKSQFKVGVVLSYVSLFMSNLVSIIYTPIMLRLIGQAEYGIYNLATSLVGYLGVMDLGFGSAVIKYTSKYISENEKEKEYNLNGMFIIIYSILGFFTLILGIIIFINIDRLYSESFSIKQLGILKTIILFMIFNMAISFPLGIFSSIILSYEKFVFPKVLGIITKIVTPILVFMSLVTGYGSVGMVAINIIISILSSIISMVYCFKVLKIKIKFNKLDFSILKEIIEFSFYIFVAMIVDKIYWSTDQLILGYISGPVVVAVYSIASTFNIYYRSFSTAISGMFLPIITKMISKENSDKEISEIFIKIGRIQYLIMTFILIGFILVGKDFIEVWAGEEYKDAYSIALLVMIPLTIPLIQTVGLSILQAKNLHKFRAKVYFIIAIINLFASIPLARLMDGKGCALATGISIVIGNGIIMNNYYYKKVNIDIPLFWNNILKMTKGVFMSFITTIFIYNTIQNNIIENILIKISIFTIVFFAFIWNISMNEYEKDIFNSQYVKMKTRLRLNLKRIV